MKRFIRWPLVAACLLAPLGVLAQTSYTVKELRKPYGAYMCNGNHVLADNGDAALICLYSSGFDFSTFSYRYDTYKVTAFRSTGAVQTLSVPSGSKIGELVGMDRNGRVLAGLRTQSSSVISSYAWWTGTTRSNFVWPAGFSGNWSLVDVSPSGKVLGLQAGTGSGMAGRIAVFQGAAAQAMVPPALDVGVMTLSAGGRGSLNDVGQVAVQQNRSADSPDSRVWFWDGAQWRRAYGGASDTTSRRIADLGASGDVLLSGEYPAQQAAVWQPSTDMLSLMAELDAPQNWDRLAIGVHGEVVGSKMSGASSVAAIWRNGVAQDLNKMVTMPSGVVLNSVRDINARGQILAVSGENNTARVWLLTPQ